MPKRKSQKVAQTTGWAYTLFPVPCSNCGAEDRMLFHDVTTGRDWCGPCLRRAERKRDEAGQRAYLKAHPDIPGGEE